VTRSSVSTLALVALVALQAPAGAQTAVRPADAGRPADGLLERPVLQALVDAQVERDGEALIRALGDSDATVRARAAFALASVQDGGAVPALLGLLGDPDPRVRADAAFAVGQTADSTVAGRLLEALGSESQPAVRRALMEAMGKTGDLASLRRLAAFEVVPEETGALGLALGRYGLRGIHAPEAVQRLAALLPSDLDGALAPAAEAAAAADAAWYFGRVQDTTAWAIVADDLRRALDAQLLAQAARDPAAGPTAALPLLVAVGRLADPRDDERLIDWAEGALDWRARVNAVRSLAGRTDRDPVRTALMEAMRDPSLHVALEAALALSAADTLPLDTQRTISQRFLTNPLPWQVSAGLGPAMVKSGGVGAVLLVLTGITGDRAVDNHALRAELLEALGIDDAHPSWLLLRYEAGSEDPAVAAAAVNGLAERWRRGYRDDEATVGEYYRIFSEALERRDLATTTAAASPLADPAFQPFGSTELLIEVYKSLVAPGDIEPMIEIVRALGGAGDPSAEPTLRATLGSPQLVLRRAAAEALTALLDRRVDVPEVDDPPDRGVDWSFLRAMGARPRLALDTGRGRIVVELDAEEAPLTVQTVLQLAQEGRYDGAPFHRVVADFVVQGGDFERGDGYGGPGFAIRSEFTRVPFERGTIGMASAGKDTEGSQYFLTHSAQPHLDGRYTAFGRVVQGMEVVDAIAEGDRVLRASVQVRSPSPERGR
jgi:peptidylprolyl isomerase